MSETFNPYQAWLGLTLPNGSRPNLYELLGLPELEENERTIASAAEKQLSKLLAIRPEGQRAHWQRLVNELAEAQSTLTHPQHKANYDRSLRNHDAPTDKPEPQQPTSVKSTPNPPASVSRAEIPITVQPQGYPAAQNQPFPVSGYGYDPNQPPPGYAAPVYPQATSGYPRQVFPQQGYPQLGVTQEGYAQPAYPQVGYPQQPQAGYAQPGYGAPVYGAPVYGGQSYGGYDPNSGYAGQPQAVNPMAPNPMSPVGMPNYGHSSGAPDPMAAMRPVGRPHQAVNRDADHSFESAVGGALPISSTTNFYLSRRTQNNGAIYMFLGLVGVVALVGGGIAFTQFGGNNNQPIAEQNKSVTSNKPKPEAVPVSTPTNVMGNQSPKSEVDFPAKPRDTFKPTPAMPTLESPTIDMPNNEMARPDMQASDKSMPEMMKPEMMKPADGMKPVEAMKPADGMKPVEMPAMSAPAKSEPEQPTSIPSPAMNPPAVNSPQMIATPEQEKALIAQLITVRTSLGERDFAGAKKELAAADKLAVTPELGNLVGEMRLIADYTEEFWNSVRKAMKGLNGELPIGNNIANVVYSDETEITIRIAGANKQYKFNALPSGLAVAIVKQWFNKDAANSAVLGSFYYVNKTSSLDEARKNWEEAQRGGVDTKGMIQLSNHPGLDKK